MKYERTYNGVGVSRAPDAIALVGSEEHAVPVLHAPKNKRAHPAGLGVFLHNEDNDGQSQMILLMEIAPATEHPGKVEPGPRGGAWNLTCGECGHRLSKKESELFEKALRAVVARRQNKPRTSHTVIIA